ncbi:hypothetical protein GQ44DRAFT_132822 [Phaeosphaeriaceae sp. PMI808]|nr:hypothetical protein GQ44DRAFT_132822 [Phaeosphaeriaceae sp. PMI808]
MDSRISNVFKGLTRFLCQIEVIVSIQLLHLSLHSLNNSDSVLNYILLNHIVTAANTHIFATCLLYLDTSVLLRTHHWASNGSPLVSGTVYGRGDFNVYTRDDASSRRQSFPLAWAAYCRSAVRLAKRKPLLMQTGVDGGQLSRCGHSMNPSSYTRMTS